MPPLTVFCSASALALVCKAAPTLPIPLPVVMLKMLPAKAVDETTSVLPCSVTLSVAVLAITTPPPSVSVFPAAMPARKLMLPLAAIGPLMLKSVPAVMAMAAPVRLP